MSLHDDKNDDNHKNQCSSSNTTKDIETGERIASANNDNNKGTPSATWQEGETKSSSNSSSGSSPSSPTKPVAKPSCLDKHPTKSSSSSSSSFQFRVSTTFLLCTAIVLLGILASTAFLGIGVSGAKQQEEDQFHRVATDVIDKIRSAFEDYANAASLVHNRCRHRNFTRYEFTELYEYLIASGLEFKAVQFDPNITHDERMEAEQEAREYYNQHYPHINYKGIVGFNTPESTKLEPRSQQDFYFPIHYMEPILGNEAAIDLDYHSSESRKRAVDALFQNKQPSLTDRLSLVKETNTVSRCGDHDGPSYGVVLMHPGVNVSYSHLSSAFENDPSYQVWPKDFSSIVICIPDLLRRSISHSVDNSYIYIHDLSHPSGEPVFLGGVQAQGIYDDDNDNDEKNENNEYHEKQSDNTILHFLDEMELKDLPASKLYRQRSVPVANRIWTVTVIASEGTYEPHLAFVIFGAIIMFLASVCVACWVFSNNFRLQRYNEMKAAADSEKAQLILENAHQATKAERELNDFIAHEVRNPVAAAMTACGFIRAAVEKKEPLRDEKSIQLAREDVTIIDNALRFVNDLLRNMLDMHRATNKQLKINMEVTDLLHDVLEPVGGMLYQRGNKIKLIIECPENLIVLTDRMRLKQVLLNLGRNSSKFIDKGFMKLKAEIRSSDGHVQLYVDDSGYGIPKEKRTKLFQKYQDSLDVLNQGTGIGLFLCENLVNLMGGSIDLDDTYNSGIPGHPGTRFIINLKVPPYEKAIDFASRELEHAAIHGAHSHGNNVCTVQNFGGEDDSTSTSPYKLPTTLSVLFVDDDPILRKLFCRSFLKVAPGWSVREASNGECAIHIIESGEDFDLIFVDMYMASAEKQLLGTETVSALRHRGVTSRICGLSANDKRSEFLEAGADAFVYKPFPCESNALTEMLCRVLMPGDADVTNCEDDTNIDF